MNGTTIRYTYDANGNNTSITDGKGNQTAYVYDELGRLIKETAPEGETKEYRYDALGSLIKYQDAEGAVTQYRYDSLGNMVETISPKGKSTTYTYDKHGNVLTETDAKGNVTAYEMNLNDQVVKLTQANGGTYTYEYDEAGRIRKTTSPLGFVTEFTYDVMDNVVEESNSFGQTTTYTYDILGRMTGSVNAKGGSTLYAYDFRNNLISETNALGYTTSYTYDVLNRLVEEKNPLGHITAYAYDPVGNLESVLAPGGAKTTYSYDANYNVADMTDPLGNVTKYAYDKSNRIITETDALSQNVGYTYNANGQVTSETDKAGNRTGYTYDIHGNVITVTDRAGYNTHYSYDELDHITKLETIHMVTGRMAGSYEYIYNEEGYIVKEIVKETIVSQWFEEMYDLFLDTIFSGIDIDDYDFIKQAWKKFYDAHHIFCDHNDADGDGQYDNCLWSYMTATTTYDYRYDENWQLTKCTEKLQNGIITEYDYQYDKDGNRSKYVKTVNGEWTECYTYEYNAANQLVSRKNERLWTDNVTYYTYDADGNLLSEQTGLFEKTYEYTAENRLAVVKAQGTVLMAALYDGDGNRLFTMDYTGENNDRWDIWIPECGGNADKVDDSAKDAMKELAGLVSWRDRKDYTITEYVNDVTRANEEVLAELNPRGKVTTAYTYGYNRESADVYGDTQYYLYDGKGNVDRISSEWGRVKETYNYDPYGNLTYGIPDTVNYYGYNGESSNLATGLQYLRARYYSPQTGNFITEDTYAGDTTNPLTLNRYTYTSNNPVNRIDPSGHSWLDDAAKAIGNGIKKAGSAIGTGIKKATNAVIETSKKVVDGVKKVASDAWNAITHPKETIQKAQQAITETAQKADNFVQEVKKDPVGTFNKIKTKATTKIEEIKSEVKRAACTSADYIKEGLGKVDWKTVGKAAVGGALVIGAVAATVATGGAALPVLLGVAGGGALGGGANALVAWANGESKGDIGKAFVDGFMWGSITGAATGGLGMAAKTVGTAAKVLQNPLVQNAAEGLIETGIETIQSASAGDKITMGGIATSLAFNSLGLIGGNKADDVAKIAKKADVEEIVGDTLDDLADAGKSSVKKPYTTSRPSYGKNQVEQVWENAKDPITGKVYDPSGVEIEWDPSKPRNGQWDMGHIPGEKYSEMHQLYMDDVITREEFLNWYRNPANYRPELPSTNRSHKYE